MRTVPLRGERAGRGAWRRPVAGEGPVTLRGISCRYGGPLPRRAAPLGGTLLGAWRCDGQRRAEAVVVIVACDQGGGPFPVEQGLVRSHGRLRLAGHGRGRPGWLHVGPLEERLTRGWDPGVFPDAGLLLGVMTLAAVPRGLAVRLAAHLTGGIYLGPGAVPDLSGFESLRDVRLPVQDGGWDRSPGVYDPVARRIGVGTVPSPSVSVCGHELGHACDHMDGFPSRAEFWTGLHRACADHLASPYREDAGELFAECFASVLTRRVTRLIRLLGDEARAEGVYHWLSGRYGIG